MGNKLNIRFWDYINCPVKIKLKPNQELIYTQSYYNGEGYTHTIYGWLYQDNKLIYKVGTDTTDCDGRLTTYDEFECNLTELHSEYNKEYQLFFPNWKRVNSHQRDFFAEAAGY